MAKKLLLILCGIKTGKKTNKKASGKMYLLMEALNRAILLCRTMAEKPGFGTLRFGYFSKQYQHPFTTSFISLSGSLSLPDALCVCRRSYQELWDQPTVSQYWFSY
ncbi:hypothetical protein D3C87_1728930 [compost metagenome]